MNLKSKNTPCLSHCAREGRHGSGLWRPPLEIMMKTTSNLGAWTTTCSSIKLWQTPGRQSSSTTGRCSKKLYNTNFFFFQGEARGQSLLWRPAVRQGRHCQLHEEASQWRNWCQAETGGLCTHLGKVASDTRFDVICYMRQNIKKDFISTIYEIISAQNYYNYFNNFN